MEVETITSTMSSTEGPFAGFLPDSPNSNLSFYERQKMNEAPVTNLIKGAFLFMICIPGAIGNLTVLLVACRGVGRTHGNKASSQGNGVTRLFFGSLAVSDLISSLFVNMLLGVDYVQNTWPASEVMCKAYNMIRSMGANASIASLTLIAIDR